MNEEIKKRFNSFIQFGICLLVAAAVAFFIIHFIGRRTVVDGQSMMPNLKDGDNLIVEKISYLFGDIKRYDVVVFPHFDTVKKEEVYYIKRVIGLPGETIQIKDGEIYIDGQILSENYGYYINDTSMDGGEAEEEYYIGEDEYFVLGDNRNASIDSRIIGCISRDEIEGKAAFRIFPFDNIGVID